MGFDGTEILLGLNRRGSTQTLVVLDGPPLLTAGFFLPLLVLRHGVEGTDSLALNALDDWGDEFPQEAVDFKQGRPEMVQEVDDKSLDVRPVVVLIGHDHDVPVAETLRRGVRFSKLETHDLDNVLNFLRAREMKPNKQ